MGLSIVARYQSLSEARVACGALQSAGVWATVFDDQFGTVDWTHQVFIGGFRVAVATRELDDAVALLREVGPRYERLPSPPLTIGVVALLPVVWLFEIPLWSWVAVRSWPTRWRTAGFALILLLSALWWAAYLEVLLRPPYDY